MTIVLFSWQQLNLSWKHLIDVRLTFRRKSHWGVRVTDNCCNVYHLCAFYSLDKVCKINHVLRSEMSILCGWICFGPMFIRRLAALHVQGLRGTLYTCLRLEEKNKTRKKEVKTNRKYLFHLTTVVPGNTGRSIFGTKWKLIRTPHCIFSQRTTWDKMYILL